MNKTQELEARILILETRLSTLTLFPKALEVESRVSELEKYYNSEHAENYNRYNEHSEEIRGLSSKINQLEQKVKILIEDDTDEIAWGCVTKIKELCEFTDGHNQSVHKQTGTHLARLPATVKPLIIKSGNEEKPTSSLFCPTCRSYDILLSSRVNLSCGDDVFICFCGAIWKKDWLLGYNECYRKQEM